MRKGWVLAKILGLLAPICMVAVSAGGANLVALEAELRALEVSHARELASYHAATSAGKLTAYEVVEYDVYLEMLQGRIERHRSVIAEIRRTGIPPRFELKEAVLPEPAPSDEERVTALDAELKASLGEFDDLLLREQEEARGAAHSASSHGSASGSVSADERAHQASGLESSGSQSEAASPGTTGAGAWSEPGPEGAQKAQEPGASRDNTQARSSGESGRLGVPRRPGARGTVSASPDRDDVVARQLREVAEKETDPVLREKLWEEYRKYKRAVR